MIICHCSYYNQGEVKDFEGNEAEWPIFFTFMIIDGVFKSNTEQIEEYQAELRNHLYADANGGNLTFKRSKIILICLEKSHSFLL